MEPKGSLQSSQELDTDQTNAVHALPVYFFKINFTSCFYLYVGFPTILFPSDFPTEI
jgi:hypothetical protein